MTRLTDVQGVGPAAAAKLVSHGIATAEALASATIDTIAAVPTFGSTRATAVQTAARGLAAPASSGKDKKPGKAKKAKGKKKGKAKSGKKAPAPKKKRKGKGKKKKKKKKKDGKKGKRGKGGKQRKK